MKIFSTFSGIGGFEIGIQRAFASVCRDEVRDKNNSDIQHDNEQLLQRTGQWGTPICIGYSEIDKYAIKVYERHFYDTKNYGDITKINADELPDFDCLVGGFPCQSFSIAGRRGGFADTRGTLFFDLARILRAKQPGLFVFENVKGLLSHDSGRTFRTIIATIDELGYDCQWQVLNSKDFGVPQNRERIIIVGHLRGTTRPQVFPIKNNDRETSAPQDDNTRIRTENRAGHGFANKYSGTIRAGASRSHNLVLKPVISKTIRTGGIGSPHGAKQNWDSYNIDGSIRRLTPLECERLQAFPDNWTMEGIDGPISNTQRYKMCGNAVTTNVIQAVFERILTSEA